MTARRMRLAARLDIKGPNLIKGIQFEGLRVVGDPRYFAAKYYNEGIDEIIFLDTVASLYGRNQLDGLLREVSAQAFIPLTAGGGIKSVEEARVLFNSGADKIAVNTAAIAKPTLISELAEAFGSQAIVVSIQAKRVASGSGWEALVENGREHSGMDAVEWAAQAQTLGAGEIMVTSVDRDGTKSGFDTRLFSTIRSEVRVPITVSGGLGALSDLVEAGNTGSDCVAVGAALHDNSVSIEELKNSGNGRQFGFRLGGWQ